MTAIPVFQPPTIFPAPQLTMITIPGYLSSTTTAFIQTARRATVSEFPTKMAHGEEVDMDSFISGGGGDRKRRRLSGNGDGPSTGVEVFMNVKFHARLKQMVIDTKQTAKTKHKNVRDFTMHSHSLL